MPDVELARRPGVELVRTGRFQTLTGSWNPTPADIKAAVEAMDCPAIRKPVIRIGHTDQRFVGDGEPALGWFENLRAADGGHTLVADQVTLPWLHSVQAAAYPSRSIEGNYNHRCSEGHLHPFVIHTVALLGVTAPGVQTLRSLNDLPDMLGVAASGEVPEGAEHVQVTILAAEPAPDGDGDDDDEHTGAIVALIPTAEDAARLAVDGGEAPGELHLTLAYLGEAADLGASGWQDILDAVSTAVNGMPTVEANAFAVTAFNPVPDSDNDTCLVYGVTGDLLDTVHDFVMRAVDQSAAGPQIPAQILPWVAHVTAAYTDDLGRLSDLAAKLGPVRFDRVRLAFAGQYTDIPLIDWDEEPDDPALVADDSGMVAAAAGGTEELKKYWLAGPGLAKWADKPHPWTALYRALLRYIKDPDEAKRTASQWYRLHFGRTPNQGVKAAEAVVPAPISDLPAAEPEHEIPTEPKEDLVSDLSEFRSRLGLDDTADEQAMLAALDELKTKAETPAPAEPTPEMVAASAAATKKAEEIEAEKTVLASAVDKLTEQVTSISGELAAVKAEKAATVKASVIGGAVREGKIKPADRETWEKDYDEAPAVTSRILASIAPGTAVPVMASGVVGDPEPATSTDGVSADEAAAWAGMWGIPSEELTRG
jgi:2'-5' RNA ligase